MRTVDMDGDGKISYKEFSDAMKDVLRTKLDIK